MDFLEFSLAIEALYKAVNVGLISYTSFAFLQSIHMLRRNEFEMSQLLTRFHIAECTKESSMGSDRVDKRPIDNHTNLLIIDN
jgi:hypothetical protein